MKKLFLILGIAGTLILGFAIIYSNFFKNSRVSKSAANQVNQLQVSNSIRNGDLIFQTSRSGQSQAIQQATGSKYSHCGIIYNNKGNFYVFEAIQPVKSTPLDEWIARGDGEHFVIKRLKNADAILTPQTIAKMKKEGDRFKGRNYDLTFEWSDDKIYCSELIWKIYERTAGIEIGELQKLREFDLSSDAVKQKMKARYGKDIPLNELVISPAAIFESELLEKIAAN